jgi:Protein of unknown function (DUF3014)
MPEDPDDKEDLEDFDIDGERGEPVVDADGVLIPPPPRRPALPPGLIAAGGLLLLALVAVFFVLRKPTPAPTASPAVADATPVPTPFPDTPVDLPALSGSDAYVREAAKGLSSHPQLGAWLAAPDLVRTLTVVIQNVAEGRSPSRFLSFLTPSSRYAAVQKGRVLVPDPKSHAAYDALADGVAAIDVAECARVYRLLAPLFGAAFAELGYPATEFEKTVARAVEVLRSTPVREEMTLRQGKVFLEFADPKLEALPLAQKHLLRMGPRNARLIQGKAAEIAQALGLSAQT